MSKKLALYILKMRRPSRFEKLQEYHHVSGLSKEMISLGKLIEDGWKPDFTYQNMFLQKEAVKVTCKRSREDGVYYLQGSRVPMNKVNDIDTSEQGGNWKDVSTAIDESGKTVQDKATKNLTTIDINEVHDKMGHKGKALIRKTLKTIGCKVTGILASCEGCAYAKAKQKAISKTTNAKATKPGQHLFLVLSGPFEETPIRNRFMIQVVDDYSRFGIVAFCKKKNDMPKWAPEIIFVKFKGSGYKIKFLPCDNAGENRQPLEGLCNKNGTVMEFPAPDTPQQNGVVERRIALLQQCTNVMLIVANFTKSAKGILWAEAVNTANDLDNITSDTNRSETPYKIFTKKESNLYSKLIEFGRLGYITIRRKFRGKWKEKSYKAVMCGYAKDHSTETYRMYTAEKHSVVESRDVQWHDWSRPDPKRGISFFIQEPKSLDELAGIDDRVHQTMELLPPSSAVIPPDEPEVSAEPEAGRKGGDTSVSEEEKMEEATSNYKEACLEREMRKLYTSWNPAAAARNKMGEATVIKSDEAGNETEKQVSFIFTVELHGDDDTPSDYTEAMSGTEKDKWATSMTSEILNFGKRKSWKMVKHSEAKEMGRTIMKTKWVYKKKDEQDITVRLKSRCVSKGFQQRSGVDYTESFSPVASDVHQLERRS
jgi:hypothetical protein